LDWENGSGLLELGMTDKNGNRKTQIFHYKNSCGWTFQSLNNFKVKYMRRDISFSLQLKLEFGKKMAQIEIGFRKKVGWEMGSRPPPPYRVSALVSIHQTDGRGVAACKWLCN
jgi:hypothetical protein